MSDYGSDKHPDLNVAEDITIDKSFLPLPKTNVMQWTIDSAISVQKYAHRLSQSNVHFKFDNS